MPMIDVYAPARTFRDKHALAQELAQTSMRWEKVPQIPFFNDNTAAFVHELAPDALSTAGGTGNHVRVHVTARRAETGARRPQPGMLARREGCRVFRAGGWSEAGGQAERGRRSLPPRANARCERHQSRRARRVRLPRHVLHRPPVHSFTSALTGRSQ